MNGAATTAAAASATDATTARSLDARSLGMSFAPWVEPAGQPARASCGPARSALSSRKSMSGQADRAGVAAALLDDDREDEQGALGDVLPERVDVEDGQPVLEHAEQDHREHGARDGALAAAQCGAAERGGGDGLQLQALAAGGRLAGAGPCGEQDAGDGG